jgi:hypothetical protein
VKGKRNAQADMGDARPRKKYPKKKIGDSRHLVGDLSDMGTGKKDNLSMTKTTIPSSSQGNFKKSALEEDPTFEPAISLKKSAIKKLSCLCHSVSNRSFPYKYNK